MRKLLIVVAVLVVLLAGAYCSWWIYGQWQVRRAEAILGAFREAAIKGRIVDAELRNIADSVSCSEDGCTYSFTIENPILHGRGWGDHRLPQRWHLYAWLKTDLFGKLKDSHAVVVYHSGALYGVGVRVHFPGVERDDVYFHPCSHNPGLPYPGLRVRIDGKTRSLWITVGHSADEEMKAAAYALDLRCLGSRSGCETTVQLGLTPTAIMQEQIRWRLVHSKEVDAWETKCFDEEERRAHRSK